MIRVGRCQYNSLGNRTDPTIEGFTNIVVMMISHSKWYPLSPYTLKNEKNQIFENIWQFSKVYEKVPKSVQKYSRYNNRIIWNHPAEIHIKNENLTDEYYKWREKGFNAPYAIRYPVGFNARSTCLYALANNVDGTIKTEKLNYIQARKEIYFPLYCELAKKCKEYSELKEMVINGKNILIIEVDGPHQDLLSYYKKKYNINDDFIVNNTMLATNDNLNIMLNDEKKPFGHGYCLAWALLN